MSEARPGPETPPGGSAVPGKCEWLTLRQALEAFVLNASGHQGQGHIRPLHYYVASRLVVEGGFHPSEITPHPPFRVIERGGKKILEYHPESGGSGERTVFGGLIDLCAIKDIRADLPMMVG